MLNSQSQNVPTVTHGEAYSLMTLSPFNLSELQSLFNQGKTAYTNHHYSDAIKHYTHVLHTLYNDVLPTIHLHCASAYEMRHQYDFALTESRYASHHPDTYFAQASAYYFQQKYVEAAHTYKRGMDTLLPERYPHQHNVLVQKHRQIQNEIDKRNQWIRQLLPYEVLSRILSMVSIKDRMRLAITCRFWHRFLMESDMMWSHIDGTHDFVRCSTVGVNQLLARATRNQVKHIALYFAENDNIQPPHRVILDPDLLHQEALDAFDDDINVPPRGTDRLIPMRTPHYPSISTLTSANAFSIPSDRPSQDLYSWITSEQKVLHLESLEITNYCEYRLCKILEACKRSLKRLKLIDCNDRDYAKHALIDVVRICPNLRSLIIVGRYNNIDDYYPSASRTAMERGERPPQPTHAFNLFRFHHQYPVPSASSSSSASSASSSTTSLSLAMLPQLNVLSLTQLTLEQNVKDSLLIEILKKSPKLACLTLPLWSGQKLANILNIIHIHSPYLQSLRYGRIMPRKDVTYSTDHHQKHHSTPISLHHGLKELEIWLAEDTVNTSKQQADMLDQLQALFQQNRNSILIVRLLGGFLSHSSFDLTLLVGQSHHGLPRLKFLELEQTRSNDSKLLADTFRACPSLEHVDFCCTHEHLCNEQAIEALASLKYLRRLSLDIKAKGWQLSDKYVLFHLFKEKYDSHLEDFTLHYWYKHTSPYMQHQFMIELAKAISRSSRLWRLDIQGIWLSEGTLETFLSHLHDSHIRELALSLCRGDVTSQHAEPFSKTEMEALASIPYLDYLKINDTEKLMLETQLREFLNKVVDCQWNQRPLVVVRIDNVHPDRCPLLGCIKRQPSIKNKGNDNHEQRQQQQETTIQLYKNENVSNSRFSVQVDQDYVDSKLKHKFDFPLRDASGYFNRATGEI